MKFDNTTLIEKLETQLESPDVRERIEALTSLAWELRFTDWQRAAELSETARQLSTTGPFEEAPYTPGLAASLRNLGMFAHQTGDYVQAADYSHRALALFESSNDVEGQIVTLNIIGLTYLNTNYAVALEYFLKALGLAEQQQNEWWQGLLLNNIGHLYLQIDENGQALEYCYKSLAVTRPAGFVRLQADALDNIAATHLQLNDYDNALQAGLESLSLYQAVGYQRGQVEALRSVGRIHLAQKNYAEANAHFFKALQLAQRLAYKEEQTKSLLKIGQVYFEQEKLDAALEYARQALNLAVELDSAATIYKCHYLLANIYKRTGDFETAYTHLEQFHHVKEVVFNKEADTRLKNLEIIHRTEQARQEAEIYQLRNVALEQEIAERQRAEGEAQDLAQKMLILAEVGREISATLDLDAVLNQIAVRAKALFEAGQITIFLRHPHRREFRSRVSLGDGREIGLGGQSVVIPGQNILGRVAQSGQPALLPDTAQSLDCGVTALEPQTVMCVPLFIRQGVIGLITLLRAASQGAFTPADLKFLTDLSQQGAIAIENARLFKEEQRQHQVAEGLRQVSLIINSSLEPATVLNKILEQLRLVVNFDGAAILLQEADELVFSAVAGIPQAHSIAGKRVSATTAYPMARVLQRKTPLVIENVWADPNWQPLPGLEYVRTWLGIPLLTAGKAIGILAVDSVQQAAYNREDTRLLQIFAIQAAIAIKNARLYKELRQAKNAAEEASHAKSAFLAHMSHELRTPLNGILGYAQILKEDVVSTPRQREGLEIIQRSGDHLLTLINDILNLSKIEAGRVDLNPTDFHFPSFLRNICDMVRIRADQKNIDFHYLPSTTLPTSLHGDEKLLRQILINLLGNAVKFTNEGSVTFRVTAKTVEPTDTRPATKRPLHAIRFEIEDTGVGIAPDELQMIFDAFYQAKNQPQQMGGTGLGLAICHKLTRLMNGQLSVVSQQGSGATFYLDLTLPEGAEAFEVSLDRRRNVSRVSGQGYKILIVDDVPENRQMLAAMLQHLGFDTHQASDGQIALKMADVIEPHAILLDLSMPQMDGFEFTRRIRQLPRFKEVVIIATSASVFQKDRRRSIELGCNAFLPKPIRREELLDLLEKFLKVSWIYQNAPVAAVEPSVSRPLVLPPHPEIVAMHGMAMIGDVEAIQNHANVLAQKNADFSPFVEKINQLAGSFQIGKLCKFLEEHL